MPKTRKGKIPRVNKTKDQIVHDTKAIENATRMRERVRKDIYPFLLQLNSTIGYSKIFLQTATTAVDSAFSEMQRTVKVGDLIPKLQEVFSKGTADKAETDKYIAFLELLKDESIFNFMSMVQIMPRIVEQYYTSEANKIGILDLPIDKILG